MSLKRVFVRCPGGRCRSSLRGGLRPCASLRSALLQVFLHAEVRDVAAVDDAHDDAIFEHGHLLQVVLAEHAADLGQVGVHADADDALRADIGGLHAP